MLGDALPSRADGIEARFDSPRFVCPLVTQALGSLLSSKMGLGGALGAVTRISRCWSGLSNHRIEEMPLVTDKIPAQWRSGRVFSYLYRGVGAI